MNAGSGQRGQQLLQADRGFATGHGLLSPPINHLLGRSFAGFLRHMDAGLEMGRIEGFLPGGEMRILGGRKDGPVAVVYLRNWRALLRVARSGSVGLYKAWALGEWDSPDPVQLFRLFVLNRKALGNLARASGSAKWLNRIGHFFRRNNAAKAAQNIAFHYDLGNDFYAAWLDDSMTYSSALFDGDSNQSLEQAQQRKMQAIADRLQIMPGDHVLEIGFGWGAMSRYVAQYKNAQVTGITLSKEQMDHAQKAASKSGLSDRLDYRLTDYRHAKGQYDAIMSVEMVEAVGQEYWGVYLDKIAALLKPAGRAAIQFITIADDIFAQYAGNVDFIQTYIFPGGMLLSESRFRALAEARGLEWHDPYYFGADYAQTLRIWRAHFDRAVEDGRLPDGFDAQFVKLWRFYLMYCEGGFDGGGINVGQATLVKADAAR